MIPYQIGNRVYYDPHPGHNYSVFKEFVLPLGNEPEELSFINNNIYNNGKLSFPKPSIHKIDNQPVRKLK